MISYGTRMANTNIRVRTFTTPTRSFLSNIPAHPNTRERVILVLASLPRCGVVATFNHISIERQGWFKHPVHPLLHQSSHFRRGALEPSGFKSPLELYTSSTTFPISAGTTVSYARMGSCSG